MTFAPTIPPPARLGKIMIGSTARTVAAHGLGHARVIDGIRVNCVPPNSFARRCHAGKCTNLTWSKF
jgi:hypothetical protein